MCVCVWCVCMRAIAHLSSSSSSSSSPSSSSSSSSPSSSPSLSSSPSPSSFLSLFLRLSSLPQNGIDVVLPDGRIIRSADCLGPSQSGRVIGIVQDTHDSLGSLARVGCRACDVLVHEATYHHSQLEKSIDHSHSTAHMAAQFAAAVEAKLLVLTHFSPRYRLRAQLMNRMQKPVSMQPVSMKPVSSLLSLSSPHPPRPPYDIVPEIIDGKNVADFVDADIAAKLDALEREEADFEAAMAQKKKTDGMVGTSGIHTNNRTVCVSDGGWWL